MKLAAIRLPLALPLLALLASCATATSLPTLEGVPIRSDGLAMIDQPTRVGDLVVTPKMVIEDSRCPSDVQCVWAGRVVLTARLDGAGWRETVDLKSGEPYRTHGISVVLISVQPDKASGAVQPAGQYVFGFEAR
ncbi:MAG: hypothetical protein ABI667_06435 [Sphingomicrobium sp.]